MVSAALLRDPPTRAEVYANADDPFRGLGKACVPELPGSPDGRTRLQEPVFTSNIA